MGVYVNLQIRTISWSIDEAFSVKEWLAMLRCPSPSLIELCDFQVYLEHALVPTVLINTAGGPILFSP